MANGIISRRTWVFSAITICAALGVYGLSSFGGFEEGASTAIADIGEAALLVAAAGMVWWAATRYGRGEPLRARWVLIALGVTMFAIGDVIWAVLEAGLGQDPYPSIADAFYLLTYVFMGPALVMIAAAHRHLISVRVPLAITTAVTVLISAGVYFGFLSAIVADPGLPLLEKSVSVIYPLADMTLLIGPSLFLALVVSRMGTALLARPWWIVAAGSVMVAFADTGMSWLSAADKYEPSSVINIGWMAGFALIAIGASVATDVAGAFGRAKSGGAYPAA